MIECSVPICDREVEVFAQHMLCRTHYKRWWSTGDVRADEPIRVAVPAVPTVKRLRRPGYCSRGHEKDSSSCRECQSLWSALNKVRKTGGRVSSRRLWPYGTREQLAAVWKNRYDVTTDAAFRAADRLRHTARIQVGTADRWCTALGLHLCLLYPELYMDPTMDVPA